VAVQRLQIFPDDADEDAGDDADALPPLPKQQEPRAKPAAEGSILKGAASAPALLTGAQASGEMVAPRVKPQLERRRRKAPPAPVAQFAGSRADLRFRPPCPAHLSAVIPRQRQEQFDTLRSSALLDQYLELPRRLKTNPVVRTNPVQWCHTGGADTFVRAAPRRDAHDELEKLHKDARLRYRRAGAAGRARHRRALRRLEAEQARVQGGGAAAVGRYALDRVVEMMAEASEAAEKKAAAARP